MSINWFTFIAQIINFLILVALLRRFLYKPVVEAMRKREEKIAASLREAEQQRLQGQELVQRYEQQHRQLDEDREQILQNARQEAEQERKRLTQDARQEVQRKRQEWLEGIQRERKELLEDLRRELGHLAVEAARRTLSQLADVTMEESMCKVFCERLKQMDRAQREQVREHLREGGDGVVVRSAFEMSEDWRNQLRQTMRDVLEYDGRIRYQQTNDLTCGLELDAGGYSFGWNADEFLQELLDDFAQRLQNLAGGSRQ